MLLREFTLGDVDAVYEFQTNPDVIRFMGGDGAVKTREDAERIIRDTWFVEYEKYGFARYAMVHQGDQRVIGFCGLKYVPAVGMSDIGYRMLPEYWGQGLATEAARAVMDYSRDILHVEKIFGEVVEENVASINVLEKLGLRHVDTYQKYGFTVRRYE
jgi:RimJ/RimL family protein N-acetyltransferase